jgi:hypothetical protein
MIYFGKNRKKEAQEKFPMWKDREISPFKGGGGRWSKQNGLSVDDGIS